MIRETLQFAVPFRIEAIRVRGGPCELDWEDARKLGRTFTTSGDLLFYKGERPGQSAEVMTDLICCLAILAFVPGGIDFAGLHFEATA